MLAILGVLVVGFVLFEGVVFGTHVLIHARWTGPLWHAHQAHHRLYNPKHPSTETFIPVGWRSFRWRALIFLLVVGAFFWLLPLWMAVALFVEVSILSAVSDYLHDATHVTDHPLMRYGWFRNLQRQHWGHHADVKKNFGILTYVCDRLNGSYER